MNIKKILKNILGEGVVGKMRNIKNLYFDGYSTKIYSQEGEDMILGRIFTKQKGIYVDVGAHHPFRFSNTYLFYKRGWRGINIDCMPNSMNLFKKFRPQDINIEVAIGGGSKQELTYYIFNEPALNTFSKDIATRLENHPTYKLIATKKIKMQTLASILDENLNTILERLNIAESSKLKNESKNGESNAESKNMESNAVKSKVESNKIDFLSIDVEGLDLEVLKSNNWEKYRPKVVLVESYLRDLDDLRNNEVYNFLSDKNYAILAKTFNTMIFQTKDK
ncbi:hypothetical protein CCY99_03350 [Helicobacter sp. 16-1353]|uniref:FkbM family methyltransferase n=1 Tax=Helicobacter sp. 16-1353 TaxID=2004996 RepID=UPI000DCE8E91|nr:FkbM family methyltransferase [Helicobacter sp. 16-1353]RAX54402.1 hypothetical protein CCY99_03350 [Helicobacter sp. 16-1353]